MSSVVGGRCAASTARSLGGRLLFDDIFFSSRSELSTSRKRSSYSSIEKYAISKSLCLLPSSYRAPRRYVSSHPKHKHRSSAASLLKPSISSPSTITSLSSRVNPPISTRPAELKLPPPPPPSTSLGGKASRYLTIGRAFFTFYKTGLKNVYYNYRASLPIRRSLGLPSYLPTSPPPAPSTGPKGTSGTAFHTAIDTLNVSRADLQLIRRAAYDVRRMIPFTLILLICGELTPLVVLALGNTVTPFTCRVPKQIDKERMRRAELKRAAFAAVKGGLGSATPIPPGSEEEMTWLADNFGDQEFATSASAEQVLRACAVFGLTGSIDRSSLLVPVIYRPRLKKWTEYLALDDRLIVRGGGVNAMSAEEVRTAVDERGGVGIGIPVGHRLAEGSSVEQREREWLERWLRRRKFLSEGKISIRKKHAT